MVALAAHSCVCLHAELATFQDRKVPTFESAGDLCGPSAARRKVELDCYIRLHVLKILLRLEVGEHVTVALHKPLRTQKPVFFVLFPSPLDAASQRLNL